MTFLYLNGVFFCSASFRVDSASLKSEQNFVQPDYDQEGRAFVEAIGQYAIFMYLDHWPVPSAA